MVSRLKLLFATTLVFASSKIFAVTDNEKIEFKKSEITLFSSATSKFGKKITVELAETEDQHERGLMNRKSLGKNNGMLFIFSDEAIRSFWMKNTLIDLSIGYFSKDKKLIDVQEMKAVTSILQRDIPAYSSSGPAQYALEMPPNWFAQNKLASGAIFKFKSSK